MNYDWPDNLSKRVKIPTIFSSSVVGSRNERPTVGILKTAIEEAILDGILPNQYEAAKEYLLKIKDEIVAQNPLTEREQNRRDFA